MRYARRKKPPPAAVHPRENGSLHICSRLNTCADKRPIYAHTQAQESSSKGPENAPTETHSPMRSWAREAGVTGYHAREDHHPRVHEVTGSQRDIFGTFDVEWQCEGVRPVRSTSSGSVGGATPCVRRHRSPVIPV